MGIDQEILLTLALFFVIEVVKGFACGIQSVSLTLILFLFLSNCAEINVTSTTTPTNPELQLPDLK